MINLLQNELTLDQLIEYFAGSSLVPLLPPLGDRAWGRVARNPIARPWLDEIRTRALAEIDQPMPMLTDELYGEFHRTGNRLNFERPYFKRRGLLARAAIAVLTESDPAVAERLMQSMLGRLRSVFDEQSWALPSHVNSPSGKDRSSIDLFSAETANLFGELLNLFSAKIDQPLQAEIKHRLGEMFDGYLNKDFGWINSSNNWNAVCHQGVLGAALAVVDDPQLLGKLFFKARNPLRVFLSGFSADGGSSEGPGYWGYGFGWFAELNHQLETRTRGRLSLVEDDPHVRAIATFGPRMTLTNGLAVNFSDNAPATSPRPALLTYLAERFDDAFIRSHAAVAWQHAAAMPIPLDIERGDLFFLTRQLLYCPTELSDVGSLPDVDVLLPDLGVTIIRFRDVRKRLWEFACKAGHNGEHHNHNDLGSYLLNIDGHRILVEIGAPEYVKSFFREERYTFLAARSLGHPVPLINQQEQAAGEQFSAKVTKWEATAEKVDIEIDLTAAYPAAANCRQCIRRFHIDKPVGRLTVTDSIKMERTSPVETAVIAEGSVDIRDGVGRIGKDGLTLLVKPTSGTRLAEAQEHPYSDHDGNPAAIQRLVLVPVNTNNEVSIGCTIELENQT
jgi:Heparinase II/III-like protein